MSDPLSIVWRFVSVEWNGVPVASLVVVAVGGAVYVLIARTPATRSQGAMADLRPGWLARRRARAGISHPRGRVGVGYRSAVGAVHLTERELAHHGALFGGPGSGKTTFLQLLVESSAGRRPIVVLDPKGSPELARTVRAHGGIVWTLDGNTPVDLMDPRPWQVPD